MTENASRIGTPNNWHGPVSERRNACKSHEPYVSGTLSVMTDMHRRVTNGTVADYTRLGMTVQDADMAVAHGHMYVCMILRHIDIVVAI